MKCLLNTIFGRHNEFRANDTTQITKATYLGSLEGIQGHTSMHLCLSSDVDFRASQKNAYPSNLALLISFVIIGFPKFIVRQ